MKKGLYILSIIALISFSINANGQTNSNFSFLEWSNYNINTSETNFEVNRREVNQTFLDQTYSSLKVDNLTLSASLDNKLVASDFPKGGNLNYPSFRKKNQWKDSLDDEISEEEIENVSLKKKYKSTIEKIRDAEEKLNVKEQKLSWVNKINKDDYMEIFMSGGGFKNGVDARLHDRIIVNNAGFVQSYYESAISGVKKTEKVVDKEELTEFIKWIAEKGFFEFEKEYTCNQSDKDCYNRLSKRPQPIPLKIVVAIGERRNVVVVPIFAPEIEKDYVNYPKELKQIVEAIYLFASL